MAAKLFLELHPQIALQQMFNLPITKSWIVSPIARRLYCLAALFSLAFLFFYSWMRFTRMDVMPEIANSPVLTGLLRSVILVGVLATAVVYVAMWYFWFTFDDSHYLKKALWFLLLWIPIGASLYCLISYRRSHFFADGPTAG